jgi:hypothetical protein
MENAHRFGAVGARISSHGKRKGQMSMLVFVLGVVFFILLGIFLFTSSLKPADTEYANMYVHNLLLSVMRKTTGYGNPCISVSDTISCAYLTPNRICGNQKCSDIASNVTQEAIESVIKPSYGFILIVEPENWDVVGGERLKIGEASIESKRPHYSANEKILSYGSNLRIELIIAAK